MYNIEESHVVLTNTLLTLTQATPQTHSNVPPIQEPEHVVVLLTLPQALTQQASVVRTITTNYSRLVCKELYF